MILFSERIRFYLKHYSLYKWEKRGFNAFFYQKLTSSFFKQLNIDTIIDIGSNEGQSTITFSLAFPKAAIHSFEPLPECFAKLESNMAEFSNVVTYNLALGEKEGEIMFEQNEYSASSSALHMTEKHISDFPYTKNSRNVKVNVSTLDHMFGRKKDLGNIMIKVDVQGYEKHVLAGATKTLSRAKLLIVETSFDTLYEGQPLFAEIYNIICSHGYAYAGSFDQLISPKTGKILQQDAIFVKMA